MQPRETRPRLSVLVACRGLALLVGLMGAGLVLGGVACFPPVLTRWILLDHHIGSPDLAAFAFVVSILLVTVGTASALAAYRMWRDLADTARRQAVRRAVGIAVSIVAALLAGEFVARRALRPGYVLTGDALWYYKGASPREDAAVDVDGDGSPRVHDSLLGWRNRPGYRGRRVTIDEEGWRWHSAPDASTASATIITLGDSFTFGAGVDDDATYSAVLDNLLDGVRVLNYGVSGYGIDQQCLTLLRETQHSPRAPSDVTWVVHAVYDGDFDRNMLSYRGAAKPRFRLGDGELRLHNVPVPAKQPDVDWRALKPRCYVFAALRRACREYIDRTPIARKWALARRLLDITRERSLALGARYLLVYIPTAQRLAADAPFSGELVLTEWAQRRGAAFLNLANHLASLPEGRRRALYLEDGHWSSAGHQAAAEAIHDVIASSG